MYVLADVEWVENNQGLISFTQIAMLRVDEKWKLVRCKSRRIRPKDASFHKWDHIAFTGGTKDDFLSAPSSSQSFEDIQNWLWPSDTICWWSNESKEWIQKMVPTITNRQIVINERVANFLGQKLNSPYQFGRKLKLLPPGEKYVLSGKKSAPKKQPAKGLSADEQRAVKRHRQAQEERMSYMQSGALRQEGKDDLYTLTQPRFAFWAASGYNTFHLRNCKKMSGLKNLKGFSLYADATAAGYRPCKCCKPTSKHDIYLSLPIYSKKRYGDGIQTLIDACEANSYEYKQDGNKFTFETPVGIWRLDTARSPYRIQHINTAMSPNNRTTFHNQPRLFHSLTDVFSYVKRHDDHIIAESMGGTA